MELANAERMLETGRAAIDARQLVTNQLLLFAAFQQAVFVKPTWSAIRWLDHNSCSAASCAANDWRAAATVIRLQAVPTHCLSSPIAQVLRCSCGCEDCRCSVRRAREADKLLNQGIAAVCRRGQV